MSHLSWHLGIGPLTVVLVLLLGLCLTLRILCRLRRLKMTSKLLGAEPKETCVLIVYIRSTV